MQKHTVEEIVGRGYAGTNKTNKSLAEKDVVVFLDLVIIGMSLTLQKYRVTSCKYYTSALSLSFLVPKRTFGDF